MAEQIGKVDRRTLLKLMGVAGGSATVVSACGTPFDQSVSAQGLTGAEFDKTIRLATAGPGDNKNWQPGDTLKFLPPEEIPTRGAASDTLAALPKEKLLKLYRQMQASRKWESTMKDLFLTGEDGLYGIVPYVRGRRGGCRWRHRSAERRRLHRQHASRPRPPDRQRGRPQPDVG